MVHKFHYSRPLRVVAGNGGGLRGRGLCELIGDGMISGIGDSKTSGVRGSVQQSRGLIHSATVPRGYRWGVQFSHDEERGGSNQPVSHFQHPSQSTRGALN